MRNSDNIRDIENLGVDFMGFIFYPRSPRYVSDLPSYLPHGCKRVGVFVNESTEKMVEIADKFALDYLQLHAEETPEQCAQLHQLGYKIIKVFSVSRSDSFNHYPDYEGFCDYFLFDTSCAGYGGSGKSFDWEVLSNYKGSTPFLLSGGLSLENMSAVKSFSHPQCAGVDLNSGFENTPANKNVSAVKTFINNINNNE